MALTETLSRLDVVADVCRTLDHACERLGVFPCSVNVTVSTWGGPSVQLQVDDQDAGRLVDVLGLDAPREETTQGPDEDSYGVHVRRGDLSGVTVQLFGRLPVTTDPAAL